MCGGFRKPLHVFGLSSTHGELQTSLLLHLYTWAVCKGADLPDILQTTMTAMWDPRGNRKGNPKR